MAAIKEDYVSFEAAKLLKEKGFDWECEYFYDWYEDDDEYIICSNGLSCNDENYPTYYSMPTLQMAMKWLRELHNLVITPVTTSVGTRHYGEWEANIYYRDSGIDATVNACGHMYGKTYEEAAETAIKYCLENLI